MAQLYVYTRFERFWHWTQAMLVIGLGVTGFDLHGTIDLFSFEQASELHRYMLWALIVIWIMAIFWHFTTGEWRHYIPTSKNLWEVIDYCAVGIVMGDDHPFIKSPRRKLNPLQRLVYLVLKLMINPLILISGLLYLYYKDWPAWVSQDLTLTDVATAHVLGAYLMTAYLIGHVYMATTGHKLFSLLKAMITGYEEVPDRL